MYSQKVNKLISFNTIKQKSFELSSKAVDILVSYAFKNDLSFVLDGNFAHYPIKKQNIQRALKSC